MIISCCKQPRVDWIPSQSSAITLALDHVAGDENLLHFGVDQLVCLGVVVVRLIALDILILDG